MWCVCTVTPKKRENIKKQGSKDLQMSSIVLARLEVECMFAQLCLTLRPHGLHPTRFLCPWHFPGKNAVVGGHFPLQGIFLTQGSNPHLSRLLHWQVDSLTTACHLGSGGPKANASSCYKSQGDGLGEPHLMAMDWSTYIMPSKYFKEKRDMVRFLYLRVAITPIRVVCHQSKYPGFQIFKSHTSKYHHQELNKGVMTTDMTSWEFA